MKEMEEMIINQNIEVNELYIFICKNLSFRKVMRLYRLLQLDIEKENDVKCQN